MLKHWTKYRSKLAHVSKERRRMAMPAPDYPPLVDYTLPVEIWTFTGCRFGTFNQVVLFPSRRRRNLFAIEVNGTLKHRGMGRDRAMRWIVKGLSRWKPQ